VGYDIEVQIPWTPPWAASMVSPPTPGSTMGFDFGIDLSLPDGPSTYYRFQSFGYVGPAPGADLCGTGVEAPNCDDRDWCTPTAQ
jgi:hypothetical protein